MGGILGHDLVHDDAIWGRGIPPTKNKRLGRGKSRDRLRPEGVVGFRARVLESQRWRMNNLRISIHGQ